MYDELERPVIYSDRLILLISKVDREIQVMDAVFTERLDIFNEDDDLANLARLQIELRELHHKLLTDQLRGDVAFDKLKNEIVDGRRYRELFFRMVEADIFPEITGLFRFCEIH